MALTDKDLELYVVHYCKEDDSDKLKEFLNITNGYKLSLEFLESIFNMACHWNSIDSVKELLAYFKDLKPTCNDLEALRTAKLEYGAEKVHAYLASLDEVKDYCKENNLKDLLTRYKTKC